MLCLEKKSAPPPTTTTRTKRSLPWSAGLAADWYIPGTAAPLLENLAYTHRCMCFAPPDKYRRSSTSSPFPDRTRDFAMAKCVPAYIAWWSAKASGQRRFQESWEEKSATAVELTGEKKTAAPVLSEIYKINKAQNLLMIFRGGT